MKPLVLLLCSVLGASDAKAQILWQLANGEWQPYQSADLPQYGFASAVVREAAALAGIRVHYVFYPWKRAEEMVSHGLVDGSLVWSRSPLRDAFALFSDPIISDREVLIHRIDRPLADWPQRERWHGVKLALPLGSRPFEELTLLERQGRVEYHRVESAEAGLRMILAGRLQAMTLAEGVYRQLRWQSGIRQEQVWLTTLPTPLETVAFSLMLSRRSPRAATVLVAFNRALQQLKHNGRYAQLARQLLPVDIVPLIIDTKRPAALGRPTL